MRHYKQWSGTLTLDNETIYFELEQASEAIDYGMDEGRIVMLELTLKGKQVALYECGWILKPTCPEAKEALVLLCLGYNRGE